VPDGTVCGALIHPDVSFTCSDQPATSN